MQRIVLSIVVAIALHAGLASAAGDGPISLRKSGGKLFVTQLGSLATRCQIGDQLTVTAKTQRVFETYVDALPDGARISCEVIDVYPGLDGECRAFRLLPRRCTDLGPTPTPFVTPTPPAGAGPCCRCGCIDPEFSQCPGTDQCSIPAPGATQNSDCNAYDIPGKLDCAFLTADCNPDVGGIPFPRCIGH